MSLTIDKTRDGDRLEIALDGRLDTNTAPELGEVFKRDLQGVSSLVLDFSKLEYVSSAGLRVILVGSKTMLSQQGTMVVRNLNEYVRSIFDVTGLLEIMTVE